MRFVYLVMGFRPKWFSDVQECCSFSKCELKMKGVVQAQSSRVKWSGSEEGGLEVGGPPAQAACHSVAAHPPPEPRLAGLMVTGEH